jgi:hypothetical protein
MSHSLANFFDFFISRGRHGDELGVKAILTGFLSEVDLARLAVWCWGRGICPSSRLEWGTKGYQWSQLIT